MKRWGRRGAVLGFAMVLATSGCAGAGGGGGGGGGGDNAISVLMVNNPQMVDLQKLTADNFTKQTGITVNYTVLPENDVRDKISQEFSSQAGQYDVASLSNFEIPIYAKNGWVAPMDDFIAKDAAFNQGDILKPMTTSLTAEDGKVYGQPFYGESSFLMYRKDVFDAKGLTDARQARPGSRWPTSPPKADGAQPNMKGICLRGQPGWGQVFAPLTTVVNTFGGTWFNKDWTPGVNAPEFKEATNFYVNLVKAHGENGAPQAGFTECLNAMQQGNVAMWYDATSAAGSLEADRLTGQGQGRVRRRAGQQDRSLRLALHLGLVHPEGQQEAGERVEVHLLGLERGLREARGRARRAGRRCPPGKRASTYSNPDYLKVAEAFAEPTKNAIETADPNNPGVQPRPAPGIQFVGIPEFPDLGTRVSQDVSAAIAGQTTVDAALDKGQQAAEQVAAKYKK